MIEQRDNQTALKRLFFALWPDATLQGSLHRLAERSLPAGEGRRTPSANIHLTLAFLGSVTRESQDCHAQAAEGVRVGPFSLVLDALGCFRRSGIFWVGTEQAPEGLLALVRAMNTALRACGHEPDTRPFRAHMTLARRLRRCPHPMPMTPIEWAVRDFVLVESRTGPRGAEYEILRRWRLA